jgi:hypothetical protein
LEVVLVIVVQHKRVDDLPHGALAEQNHSFRGRWSAASVVLVLFQEGAAMKEMGGDLSLTPVGILVG